MPAERRLRFQPGDTSRDSIAEGVVAWARAQGSDTREVRDAAHEASHAVELRVNDWHRESIHAAVMELPPVERARTEVEARAVEQLVCEALGVHHEWDGFLALCAIEATRSGVVFPNLETLKRMVATVKRAPQVVRRAEWILREGLTHAK